MNRVSSLLRRTGLIDAKKGGAASQAAPFVSPPENYCVTAFRASTIPLPKKFVYPPAVPLQYAL